MFILSQPGDISDWIVLSQYAKAQGWDALAEMLGPDLRIKVRVLSDRQYKQFCADAARLADADDALVRGSDKDVEVCKAGLAAIDGVSPPQPEITDALIDALAASHVHALIASCILKHHTLDPSERAAFFTWEPAA